MKNNKLIGGIILALALVAIVAVNFINSNKPKQVEVKGLVGGEKIPWLENESVKKIAKDKYGVKYNIRKEGSIEMVQPGAYDGYNFLFPASQFPADLFKQLGGSSKMDDIVVNTPIVLFSRKPVVDALIAKDFASESEGVYYVDMKKLAEAIRDDTSWESIGLGELYGDMLVDTTDPNASNSGNMFLGLLANALNGNKPVDQASVEKIKGDLKKIFTKVGYSHTSSSDLFNQFLQQGMGAYPIIAAYENQLLEFSLTNPEIFEQVKDELVILYPTPTVWSSHVFIALDDDSRQLYEALRDPEVQKIAWETHGFRTTVAGAGNIDSFKVTGVAKDIKNVMALPNPKIMMELMKAVD